MKTENGKIIFDIPELLEQLKGEEQLNLIESLSCQEAVIKHVAEQIIDGYTERGWHGAMGCSETPHTELDKARRFVADNSGELAKNEIRRLESLVKSKEKFLDESWKENRSLRDELSKMKWLA